MRENAQEFGLVSVVMPSYNSEHFIAESIKSVQSQTYGNWELLIVDDCSTDGTVAVAEAIAMDDSRVHVFSNERNSGAACSRNRALREAKGDWVAFLDSDDLWEPDKLERQLAFMRDDGRGWRAPRASLLGACAYYALRHAPLLLARVFDRNVRCA